MTELVTDELVRQTAEAIAYHRWPDQTVQDEPELIDLMIPEATAALEAAAPLIAARVFEEAADDWQRGEWADAPRRADRVQERIANGEHVGQWLRARGRRWVVADPKRA